MIHTTRPAWLKQTPGKIDLVFFDLETTGGNPRNSSIIEIGAIKYSNGKEVGRFETLVKARHPISPIVQRITGIDNAMIQNAPYIEDIFEDFLLFVDNALLVSHGASADIAFFTHYKEKLFHKPFANYFFCTHLLATHFLPDLRSKSLTGVAEYFNFYNKYAHTALDDAITTEHIFWKIYEICVKQGYETCEDLIKIQGDQDSMQKLGLGFDPALLNNAPSMSGLLFILGNEHEISYLSASTNLKKSLSSIVELTEGNKDFQKILVDAAGFKIERTSNFLDALIREKNELKKLSLPLDPRIVQKRSESFLQIFIPQDLIKYAIRNAKKAPFLVPEHSLHIAEQNENAIFSDEHVGLLHKMPFEKIKHTKKHLSFIKTKKFTLNRRERLNHTHSANTNIDKYIHYGYLHEGIGYAFGVCSTSDDLMPFVSQLIKKYPFHNHALPFAIRCDYLLKVVEQVNEYQSNKYALKSGLCVISNNAFKEFEIFVVARSQVVKKINLPFEQAEKLKSSRYFTRLFEKHYHDVQKTWNPIYFTDDTCSNIELFSYWLSERNGEGEWIEFSKLEPLFDKSILDTQE